MTKTKERKSKERKYYRVPEQIGSYEVYIVDSHITFDVSKLGSFTPIKSNAMYCESDKRARKILTYKMLVVLAHYGYVPKSYITKINNKSIGFETAYEYIKKKYKELDIPYNILSSYDKENKVFYMLLIEIH